MNDVKLYEILEENGSPIKLIDYKHSPYDFDPHWHEHTGIQYIFSGNPVIKCADKIVQLHKNDCFIVNSNDLHEEMSDFCDYGCIIIPPKFFGNNHVIFNNLINDETVSELITCIFGEYRDEDHVTSHLAIKGYTYLLISYLIRHYSTKVLSETPYQKYYSQLDKINKAMTYINKNYSDNITTAGLADMVHLSEAHFCHVFKDVTGKTAKEYINSLRIKKATDLLRETAMSITNISYCCGFSDANYFTRIYKKYTGNTPSSVRDSLSKSFDE